MNAYADPCTRFDLDANPEMDRQIAEMVNGKGILVTGGTGSFGRSFIKTLLKRYQPARVVIYSRDELKQHEMQTDPAFQHNATRFFIGDVRDRERLEMALRGVDIIIHAAALKQVPAAEYNPFECIRTNVMGAENVVNAAIRAGVRRVIALSTDKAANPVNLYGASKLASDKIFVAGNHLGGKDGPRFAVVRYGNVIGSRGSVVPFFERLLDEGTESLPLTDERMTRFWITLDQGVNFVLSSLAMMNGGETFIPRIPSMLIKDMAEALAPGMPTHVVGIRPGEKLHEIMVPSDEARSTIELPDRYIIQPTFNWWNGETYTHQGAKAVDEDFTYSSDRNTEWLTGESLMRLLNRVEPVAAE